MEPEPSDIKSFKLYRPKIPVQQFAADYGPEDLKRFREMFRPIAENFRRWKVIRWIIIVVCFAYFLICCIFQMSDNISWWVLFFGCWLAYIVSLVTESKLKCPACGNDMSDLGLICPECGDKAVQKGGWFSRPSCTSCGERLGRGRHGRSYKIRACTHCGVKLDDEGV